MYIPSIHDPMVTPPRGQVNTLLIHFSGLARNRHGWGESYGWKDEAIAFREGEAMDSDRALLGLLEQAQAARHSRTPLPVGLLVVALRRLLAQGAPPTAQPELYERLKALQDWLRKSPPSPSEAGVTAEELWTLGDLVERALRAIDFAQRLAALQGRQGLSVPELADRAGVDRSLIYKLHKGAHAPPSAETVRRLAVALGVAPHELLPPGTPARRPRVAAMSLTAAVAYAEASPGARQFLEGLMEAAQKVLGDYVLIPRWAPGAELLENVAQVLAHDPPEVCERRLRVLSLLSQPGQDALRALEPCLPAQSGANSADKAR